MMVKPMRIGLIIGGVIAALATIWATSVQLGVLGASNDLRGLASNIVAEAFGIIVTVVIIERLLAHRTEVERLSFEKAALRELRWPLRRYLALVGTMARCAGGQGWDERKSLHLLTDDTAAKIGGLSLTFDPASKTAVSTDSYADVRIAFTETTKEVVTRYMPHLSLDLFKAIEALAWLGPGGWSGDPPKLGQENATRLVAALRDLVQTYQRLGGPPLDNLDLRTLGR